MIYKLMIIVAALLIAGCGAETIDEHPCPPEGTMLTYENFGRNFIGVYCQNCHGQSGPNRQGAPLSFDFGTLQSIRGWKERIFVRAAYSNSTMPPGPDDPPQEERNKLGEWLSCNAP